jgi:NADP-dependent 3-hydroxy acid dehydrogenase YdfG
MSKPVFLITGGAGGIGSATACLAAQAGFTLVLAGRRKEALEEVRYILPAATQVLTVSCDVSEWAQMRDLIDLAEDTFGRLDVAFANAGISPDTSFLGAKGDPPEEWREAVLTNVLGPALTARAALPALVRAGGHLVLSGSVAGRGLRIGSLYSATKWAVTALSQSIRSECVGTGVRVTLIQPGLVDTEPSMLKEERRNDPRLEPSDVARAVLFAVGEPRHVDVSEIVIRPVGASPYR